VFHAKNVANPYRQISLWLLKSEQFKSLAIHRQLGVQWEQHMFPHVSPGEIDLAKSIIGLLTVIAPFFLKKLTTSYDPLKKMTR